MAGLERFAGKVGVITGGASGIGLAIATRFVSEGGKIVIGDFNTSNFEEITKKLGADNCACFFVDVSKRPTVDALVEKTYETFGRFDVMFGNAGIQIFNDFLTFTEEDHDRVFAVNYKGVFNTSQAAGRAFVAHDTKGVIVNTASINVRCACQNSAPYTATKGAIAALTRAVAVELAKYGIRANCVCPGSTETAMTSGLAKDRFPTYTAPRLSIQRMATPEEQAGVYCFLASDDASYITGESIFSVGGWGIS
ncbi:MAG: SDR family oxidoreductase [Oscillospiraceae bacterium]